MGRWAVVRAEVGSGVVGCGRGFSGRKSVGGPRGSGVKRLLVLLLLLVLGVGSVVLLLVSCQRRLSQALKRGVFSLFVIPSQFRMSGREDCSYGTRFAREVWISRADCRVVDGF